MKNLTDSIAAIFHFLGSTETFNSSPKCRMSANVNKITRSYILQVIYHTLCNII